jgi:hypothetical protein
MTFQVPQAQDICGTVFRRGTVLLLARVVAEDGRPIHPETIASAEYTIFEVDPEDPEVRRPIAGHTARTLSVGQLLSDRLRTDFPWDVDEVGYNFRHLLDVAEHPAFPQAGRHYLVEFTLRPSHGQIILVRFRLYAI